MALDILLIESWLDHFLKKLLHPFIKIFRDRIGQQTIVPNELKWKISARKFSIKLLINQLGDFSNCLALAINIANAFPTASCSSAVIDRAKLSNQV
jgi:hypothetical protein